MSVIVELTVPAGEFELGEILSVEEPTKIALETVVPLGGRATPFVRFQNGPRSDFEKRVRDHSVVKEISEVNSYNDEVLYALDWDTSEGSLIQTILNQDAALLHATGSAEQWKLDIRFPSYEELSAFQEYCMENDIELTVDRIYNPTRPDAGQWYGLTPAQRETLTHAVEAGYYSLPRKASTKDLAAEFDISDQAVTERLRRGIVTLVTNTLIAAEEES